MTRVLVGATAEAPVEAICTPFDREVELGVGVASSAAGDSASNSPSSSSSTSSDGGGGAAAEAPVVTERAVVSFDPTAVVEYNAAAAVEAASILEAPDLTEAHSRRSRLGTISDLPRAWRAKLLKRHVDLEAGNGRGSGTCTHKKFVEWISDAEVEVHDVRESCKLLRDGSEVSFTTTTTKRFRAPPDLVAVREPSAPAAVPLAATQ